MPRSDGNWLICAPSYRNYRWRYWFPWECKLPVPKGINYASAKVYPQSKKLLWLACVCPSRNIFAKTFFTSSEIFLHQRSLEKYYRKWTGYLLTQIFGSFYFTCHRNIKIQSLFTFHFSATIFSFNK